MKKSQEIFQKLDQAADLKSKADKLVFEAMAMLLDQSAENVRKTDNLINSLASPELGDIYNSARAARLLNISKNTLYKLVKAGRIPHIRPFSPGGKITFYKHQLTEYLCTSNTRNTK